jgi:putative oxidoreductase
MAIIKMIDKAYGWFSYLANWLQPLLLLVFRLNWGWQFFITGKGKLANHGDIVDFFTSLGIPFPDLNAWFVGGLETVGGLLLLVGLASRPVALLLASSMTVAYLTAERDALNSIFTKQDDFLQADPFFFLLTSLLVLAFGPGLFSVDALLSKFVFKKKAAIAGGAANAIPAMPKPAPSANP